MSLLIDLRRRLGESEIFPKPIPSTREIALFPPIKNGETVTINSSKRFFLIKSQFTVPPPSTSIVLIFFNESFFSNNFRLTES